MGWVTGAQATTLTNLTITDAQVAAAAPIIEIYTNVTTAVSGSLKPRDLRLLRLAESYQAYWMPRQVDHASRMDVDQVTQDGVTFAKGDPDTFTLAPLAALCVRRLSWMKSRTIMPLTAEQALILRGIRTPDLRLSGAEEFLDNRQRWKPLRGGYG